MILIGSQNVVIFIITFDVKLSNLMPLCTFRVYISLNSNLTLYFIKEIFCVTDSALLIL